jgi:hypothetical protein
MTQDIIKKKILENLTRDELVAELKRRDFTKPMAGVLAIDENQIQFKIDTIEWIPGVYHVEIHYVKDYDVAAHIAREAATKAAKATEESSTGTSETKVVDLKDA